MSNLRSASQQYKSYIYSDGHYAGTEIERADFTNYRPPITILLVVGYARRVACITRITRHARPPACAAAMLLGATPVSIKRATAHVRKH